MSHDARPVLSIIVRRFGHEFRDDIMQSLEQLQKAAANEEGYLGDHNSLSQQDDCYELVNVFSFDSRKNLERWESSDLRKECLADLDRHPQKVTRHPHVDEFSLLLSPKSRVSKIEIVVILIFWILVLGATLGFFADLLLPATFPAAVRSVLLISINVVLISYIFLPWSSSWLTRLKTRLAVKKSGK
ncbi:antibiotic biosynthesis monooxygenase (ABM) superfamily enzyme [Litoreibacter halocynthiae]|uniref:Antibiotic biosynthesis monooxygenase (ABM) superfamily enzyme n=1 Tax=Litoreibacter halocynthiae TaxID=1242689 RepID=A0A4R7LM89_9RHOB|nr:hypothetical protein [Litoreibacter halocynthiae]TDT75250.1 antibiotic biosynthesis monooxygenase (ABM) superfamily enzyme [Litoreibacter halocynthiae]